MKSLLLRFGSFAVGLTLLSACSTTPPQPQPAVDQHASDAVWAGAVAKQQSTGRAIIYRFVYSFPTGFSRARLPARVHIAWSYESQSGMPSREELDLMGELEELLVPVVERGHSASLVLVSTGENLREWVFYAESESAFRTAMASALSPKSAYPIQVLAEPDPSWSSYESFRRTLRE